MPPKKKASKSKRTSNPPLRLRDEAGTSADQTRGRKRKASPDRENDVHSEDEIDQPLGDAYNRSITVSEAKQLAFQAAALAIKSLQENKEEETIEIQSSTEKNKKAKEKTR